MRLGYVPDIPTNDVDSSAVSRSIFKAARACSHSFFPCLIGGRVDLCRGRGILSLSTPDVLATLMCEEEGSSVGRLEMQINRGGRGEERKADRLVCKYRHDRKTKEEEVSTDMNT